jgi:dipeptidyl aminopeptidase/acylaminoacyl peptidase
MNRSKLKWLAAAVPLWLSVVPLQSPDPPGALPYDLAFDRHELVWSTSISVTADGRHVAYDARARLDSNLDARYQPNGTPSYSVGSSVYLAGPDSGEPSRVEAGGSSWRGTWSPDGKLVAFYSDAGGAPELWVYDPAAKRSRRVTAGMVKAKLWTGDEPHWSPDGATLYVPMAPDGEYHAPTLPVAAVASRSAIGVTVLQSGSEIDSASRVAPAATPIGAHYLRENLASLTAVDVRTGAARVLVPATATPKPSVLRLSASGRWLSYLSVFKEHGATSQVTTVDLAVVSTSGGPIRVLAADLPQLTDYHRLNYAWHPTRDQLVYLKDKRLWLVDLSGGSPAAPRQLAADLGDLAPTVNWFTRDGRAVVVGIDPWDDKDYRDPRPRGLAIVPLDGGPPTRFAFDDSKWVFRSIVKADDRTLWQPDSTSITVVFDDRVTGEKAVVRYDPAGGARILWKGIGRIDNLSSGGSHQFIVGTYQDLRTPPDVYRFAADFSSKTRLSHLEPRLDRVAVGTAETFETTVPVFDGSLATVHTAILLPAGAKRGDRLPAIVMMYPGSDVSQEAEQYGGGSTMTVPTLLFTSRGYAVLLAHLKLGPNGQPGNPMQEMVDVLLPQVYRAAALGYIDPTRIALGGQSFGGYGTASIVTRTNLFRAAAAVSGIYDLPGTYGHFDQSGGSFWIGWSEGGQARMGAPPWSNLKRYVDNSPYYQADKIVTPLLLIHGTADLAYHDAQKLFSALRRLERPAELAAYAGQGHVISEWSRADAMDAAARMVRFFHKHLGDPPARAAP